MRPSAKSRREWELFGVRFLAGNLQPAKHCYLPPTQRLSWGNGLLSDIVQKCCNAWRCSSWHKHGEQIQWGCSIFSVGGVTQGPWIHWRVPGDGLRGSDLIRADKDDKDGISAGELLAPEVVAVLSHTAGQWCRVCATISDTFSCSESQGLAHWGQVLHISEQLSLLEKKSAALSQTFLFIRL